ncbi:MAG: motility associated factor glycosyltransferase family protein [Succinivibrio sp.]|nr:motility associated factor glycosyltransferase family protein [Succinivibrio sp.]
MDDTPIPSLTEEAPLPDQSAPPPAPECGTDPAALETLLRTADGKLEQLAALREALAALPNYLEARFAANLEALERYDPDLHLIFAHRKLPAGYQFFCNADGVPNLRLPDGRTLYGADPEGYCQELVRGQLERTTLRTMRFRREPDYLNQIHFRYLNESLTLLEEAPPEPAPCAAALGAVPCCYLLGTGLGYIAGALCAQLEMAALVVIEPDPNLFLASLYCFDWAGLLEFFHQEGRLISFYVGVGAEHFESALRDFYEINGRFLSAHTLSIVHDQTAQMAALVAAINRSFHLYHASMGLFDDNLFNISHGCQALLHRRPFARLGLKLPEELRDVPYFVVGNGPSLDKDIPFLRKHQDQALIIACGTALDTLYHAGIQPDFYGCTERAPHIKETIRAIPDQNFIASLMLLGTEVVHPWTLECFNDCLLFGKYGEAFYSLASRFLDDGCLISPTVGVNPLVGNLGLATSIMLGFKHTYFFGIDNGTRLKDGEMHSSYNAAYTKAGVTVKGDLYKTDTTVPANFGGSCESTYIFILSRDYLAQDIAAIQKVDPQRQYYNCSDGALIQGAVPLRSAALEMAMQEAPAVDKQAFKQALRAQSISFAPDEEQCRKLCHAELFESLVEECRALWHPLPHSRAGYLLRMVKNAALLFSAEGTEREAASLALQGTVNSLFIVLQSALCRSADEALCLELGARLISLYDHFLQDALTLYRSLPYYVSHEHVRQLHGFIGADYPDSKAPPVQPIEALYPQPFDDPHKVFVKRYE